MTGPIYKLWMIRYKEAWYHLTQEEQNAHLARIAEALQAVGGKAILTSFSGWSSEQWLAFGLEEFPNIEAVQALTQRHYELSHFLYVESFTLLGTQLPPTP